MQIMGVCWAHAGRMLECAQKDMVMGLEDPM
jgi:hypothetical protein